MTTSRNVFVLGPTNSGKSTFSKKFFQLRYDDKKFKTSCGIRSCTSQIEHDECKSNGISIRLFDTPGFLDTEERTKDFVKDIIDEMKKNKVDNIIFFLNFDKWPSYLQATIEALQLCFPNLNSEAVLLVINKIPNIDGEEHDERKKEILEARDHLCHEFCQSMKIESIKVVHANHSNKVSEQMSEIVDEIKEWLCYYASTLENIELKDFEQVEEQLNDERNKLRNEISKNKDLVNEKKKELQNTEEAVKSSEKWARFSNLAHGGFDMFAAPVAQMAALTIASKIPPLNAVAGIVTKHAIVYPIAGKLYRWKMECEKDAMEKSANLEKEKADFESNKQKASEKNQELAKEIKEKVDSLKTLKNVK